MLPTVVRALLQVGLAPVVAVREGVGQVVRTAPGQKSASTPTLGHCTIQDFQERRLKRFTTAGDHGQRRRWGVYCLLPW